MSADVSSKIQTALQQNPDLSGVTASMNGNKIELSGNVSKREDRKEAVKIARDNANGKKVVDHIKVGGAASSNSATPQTTPESNPHK